MPVKSQVSWAAMKRIIRLVFAVFAAVFVFLVIKDMSSKFKGIDTPIAWPWVVLAIVPTLFAVLLQYEAWRALLINWSARPIPRLLSLRIYVDGQIARYTPGKVGLPAVRVAGAPLLGVSPQIMIATLLVEVLSWAACGTILGGLIIYSQANRISTTQVVGQFFGLLGVASTCGLVLLVLVPRTVWPRALVHLLSAQGTGPLVPWRVPLLQLAHFLASALGGLCLVVALGGSLTAGVYLGAVLCVAIVAGFLALLAPAGVGVREAMIAVFAEPVLGVGGAVALGLLARGVSLSSELGLFVLLRVLTRKKRPA